MYDERTRARARELAAAGASSRQVGRALGIDHSTVARWLRPTGRRQVESRGPLCPRCWRRYRGLRFDAGDYAELLGLYLGDGYICRAGRTQRLRISLDSRYPVVIAETRTLLARCFSANSVGVARADRGSTTVLSVYSSHLACALPQHGPGRKHERAIVLESWQEAICGAHPWRLLRGCFRSDGCAFVNRTGRYAYLSYDFTNHSQDVLDLFERTCATVGVETRRYPHRIRIYRRASVAAFAKSVGVKT